MDDLGRPSRRQASSDRRSSSQRIKPRTRASNQSLQSAGRPQESATFTSFEPFSPPNNLNGYGFHRDDASVRSDSSSKRSRSIFAPHRANSVVESTGNMANDPPEWLDNESQTLSHVSQASKSLMHAVLDTEPEEAGRTPLFQDNLNSFRTNPRALAQASETAIYQAIRREGDVIKLIRTLANDLADRDAEITRLRKRNEQLAFAYKDHLTRSHSMSRLDADLAVRDSSSSLSIKSATSSPSSIEEDVNEAHDNPFGDRHRIASDLSLSTRGSGVSMGALPANTPSLTSDTSTARKAYQLSRSLSLSKAAASNTVSSNTVSAAKPRSGFLGMFGGSRTVKAASNNRHSIAGVMSLPPPNAKGQSQTMRSPNLAMSPRPESITSPPPLEMEQKIESEDLPPPLLSMKLIKLIFRGFTADNYGFIIDEARVIDWLLNPTSQGAHTKQKRRKSSITTRASSIASTESGPQQNDDDDDVSASDAEGQSRKQVEEPTSHWYEYLTLGGSKRALLSRLPIQLQGPAEDEQGPESLDEIDSDRPKLEDLIDPSDFTENAERLRDEISEEYTSLQIHRNQSWTRFWDRVEARQEGGNRLSRLFTGGGKVRAESIGGGTIGIASLALSTFEADFIRFVLDGIPMKLRPKVWLECAEASIHYGPKAYEQLTHSHPTEAEPTYLHDIRMDSPRTLTNNVYFREAKNQAELSNLLGCFALRNKDIGYCQGFNIIAGYLLLAMPTTEQAFWVFCFLIESVFPQSYFTAAHDWKGPRIDIIVLRGYIRQLMPRLAAHLDELEITDEQTVPINWFLTAFASTLSVEALFRVWDVVLSLPGQQLFLLKVAIALLKVNEERLLAISSASALYACLDRGMNAEGVSVDGLIQASWHLRGIVTPKRVEKQRRMASEQLAG